MAQLDNDITQLSAQPMEQQIPQQTQQIQQGFGQFEDIAAQEINVEEIGRELGLNFYDHEGGSKFKIRDETGKTGTFDIAKYINENKDVKYDPNLVNFNSPSTAIAKPEKDDTRYKGVRDSLIAGNLKGQVKLLTKEYGQGNVAFDKDKGLVYKKSGVWRQVDPGISYSLMNPWELTQDIREATPAIASGILAVGAGMGAAALGAPVLAAGAVGVAATAGASLLNTSFGRLRGSYEGDFTEQGADAALETVMTLGFMGAGQLFKAGAVPALKAIATSLEKSNQFTNEGSKKVFRNLLGLFSNVPDESLDFVMRNPGAVTKEASRLVSAAKNKTKKIFPTQSEINEVSDEIQLKFFKDAISGYPAALTGKFKGLRVKMLNDPDIVNFPGTIADDSVNLLKSFTDKGLIKKVGKAGKEAYELAEPRTLAASLADQNIPISTNMAKALLKPLQEVIDIANHGLKRGAVSGKQAAEFSIGLRTTFDKAIDKLSKNKGMDGFVGQEIKEINRTYRTAINDAFEQTSDNVKNLWGESNKLWREHNGLKYIVVKGLKESATGNTLTKRGAIEKMLNQVISSKGVSKGDAMSMITDVAGTSKVMNSIMAIEHAKNFTSLTPTIRHITGGQGALLGTALFSPSVATKAAAGAAFGLTGSRTTAAMMHGLDKVSKIPFGPGAAVARKAVDVIFNLKGQIQNMPLPTRRALLNDPFKLEQFFAPIFTPEIRNGLDTYKKFNQTR